MKGRLVANVGPGTLAVQEHELPEVAPGAVLLRVRRANVCGSELGIFHWRNPVLRNVAMGHEFVGEVDVLGEGVTTDSAGQPIAGGDRVVAVYYRTCHACGACDAGEFNMCENALSLMVHQPEEFPHFTGAYATHYYVDPDQYFYKVPDELSDAKVAGANCGLAQMLFSLDEAGLRRGSRVVIQGAGGLGLYATAIAASSGAQVMVIEREPARIELARRFGAETVVDMGVLTTTEQRVAEISALTGGRGADVVVEVTGRAEAFPEAIELARTGGTIVSVGNLTVGEGHEVTMAPAIFTRKNLTIRGFVRYDPWYLRRALEFLARYGGDYPFESMSDRTYSLDEVAEAFRQSESHSVARPAIVPA